MSRRNVSLAVLAIVAALLIVLAPDVLLTVFAGMLMAVGLRGGGGRIARWTRLPVRVGIGLFMALLIGAVVAAYQVAAPAFVEQAEELAAQLPEALSNLRDRLEDWSWGRTLLQEAPPQGLLEDGGRFLASTAVGTTFGALGSFVIMLFIGVYGALDPELYRSGVRAVLAPSLHAQADAVMDAAAATLRNWLTAQIMAMTVVGVLTGLGLWALGIPLAFILGLIAALLAFIPNIGPVLSAVPALLLAFLESWSTVAWVLAVYAGVQTLESYVITPLLQQEKVSLPPALVIASQLLLGVLFGLLGLMLATPLAALAMTLVREIYVDRWLAQEPAVERARETGPGAGGRTAADAEARTDPVQRDATKRRAGCTSRRGHR